MDDFIKRLQEVIDSEPGRKHTPFAKKAGIHPSTFANYMKGDSKPNSEALKKICETYNVNINWLLTGVGDKYIDNNGPEDEPPPVGGKALPEERFRDIHHTLKELAGLSDTALRDVEMFLAGMVKGLRNRAGMEAGDSGPQEWDGTERRSGADRRRAPMGK